MWVKFLRDIVSTILGAHATPHAARIGTGWKPGV